MVVGTPFVEIDILGVGVDSIVGLTAVEPYVVNRPSVCARAGGFGIMDEVAEVAFGRTHQRHLCEEGLLRFLLNVLGCAVENVLDGSQVFELEVVGTSPAGGHGAEVANAYAHRSVVDDDVVDGQQVGAVHLAVLRHGREPVDALALGIQTYGVVDGSARDAV